MTTAPSLISCRRLAAAILLAAPAVAHAHPGHTGDHDLTWDFIASHPLVGLAYLLGVAGLCGLAAIRLGGLRPAASKLARVAAKVRGARGK
jgi:hydrogenase/urease accessory protein HupE